MRLKPESFRLSEVNGLQSQCLPAFVGDQHAPDVLAGILLSEVDLESLLVLAQLQHFLVLWTREPIKRLEPGNIGVIEREFEDRPFEGAMNEPIRRIVVEVPLLESSANNPIGIDLIHHLTKTSSEFTQLVAYASILSSVEEEPVLRHTQRLSGTSGFGSSLVGRMSPTEINVVALRS